MNETYSYRLYGLNVLSDIECCEVVELQGDSIEYDVVIEVGTVDSEIKQLIEQGYRSQYTEQKMWFYISNLAIYSMLDGNKIVIELQDGASKLMAKQYLLGSCLGMIMLQRKMIAIHGGTIMFGESGVIFTGQKGAGKSTITSALRKAGYSFIADDVSSLTDGEKVHVYPGFPQHKLCQDAAIELGYQLEDYASIMGDTQIKYLIPAHDAFVNRPVPLRAIVELQENEHVEGIEVEELKGTERLMTIYRNIFRIEMKQLTGMDPEYFKKCIEIAQEIPVYRLKRQQGTMTIKEQIAWLEKTFSEAV